jgi:hypothetical protein
MRIAGLVAAVSLSACHPVVGIVGDGTGPRVPNSAICDQMHDDSCAPGHGHGSAVLAYAAIAAVFAVPFVLRMFRPHGSYYDR